MLSCHEVLEELSSYLDDDLAAELRRELEEHLAECSTCQVLYDSTRKTLKLLTNNRAFEIPEGLSRRIVGKVMGRLDPQGNRK